MASLEITRDSTAKWTFPIKKSRILLGSSDVCDVVLQDQGVGQVHACLSVAEGGYNIEDVNSESGTFVNGERVQGRRQLQDNDAISIGRTKIVFSAPGAVPDPEILARDAALREWARQQFREEDILAQLRELREKGGRELDEFLPELERIVEHP